MAIWRINLKPAAQLGINPRKHCLEKGIVGFGWQINYGTLPITSQLYESEATKLHYNTGDKSWWPAWNAFYNKMQLDDLIWTRDKDGIYYLGRISSQWYYDTNLEAAQADVVNIRKCDWLKVGTIDSVPGKLINCFIPSRTLQMVHDDAVNQYSKITYNKLTQKNYFNVQKIKSKDIFSLLSSDDCEDALALYLQIEHDYMVLPSSCKQDTLAYEYVLIHRKTGESAVVQVKNGYVNLDMGDYENHDCKVFLLTTKGQVIGNPNEKIITIEPEIIMNFIYNNFNLMPVKIKTWLTLTM